MRLLGCSVCRRPLTLAPERSRAGTASGKAGRRGPPRIVGSWCDSMAQQGAALSSLVHSAFARVDGVAPALSPAEVAELRRMEREVAHSPAKAAPASPQAAIRESGDLPAAQDARSQPPHTPPRRHVRRHSGAWTGPGRNAAAGRGASARTGPLWAERPVPELHTGASTPQSASLSLASNPERSSPGVKLIRREARRRGSREALPLPYRGASPAGSGSPGMQQPALYRSRAARAGKGRSDRGGRAARRRSRHAAETAYGKRAEASFLTDMADLLGSRPRIPVVRVPLGDLVSAADGSPEHSAAEGEPQGKEGAEPAPAGTPGEQEGGREHSSGRGGRDSPGTAGGAPPPLCAPAPTPEPDEPDEATAEHLVATALERAVSNIEGASGAADEQPWGRAQLTPALAAIQRSQRRCSDQASDAEAAGVCGRAEGGGGGGEGERGGGDTVKAGSPHRSPPRHRPPALGEGAEARWAAMVEAILAAEGSHGHVFARRVRAAGGGSGRSAGVAGSGMLFPAAEYFDVTCTARPTAGGGGGQRMVAVVDDHTLCLRGHALAVDGGGSDDEGPELLHEWPLDCVEAQVADAPGHGPDAPPSDASGEGGEGTNGAEGEQRPTTDAAVLVRFRADPRVYAADSRAALHWFLPRTGLPGRSAEAGGPPLRGLTAGGALGSGAAILVHCAGEGVRGGQAHRLASLLGGSAHAADESILHAGRALFASLPGRAVRALLAGAVESEEEEEEEENASGSGSTAGALRRANWASALCVALSGRVLAFTGQDAWSAEARRHAATPAPRAADGTGRMWEGCRASALRAVSATARAPPEAALAARVVPMPASVVLLSGSTAAGRLGPRMVVAAAPAPDGEAGGSRGLDDLGIALCAPSDGEAAAWARTLGEAARGGHAAAPTELPAPPPLVLSPAPAAAPEEGAVADSDLAVFEHRVLRSAGYALWAASRAGGDVAPPAAAPGDSVLASLLALSEGDLSGLRQRAGLLQAARDAREASARAAAMAQRARQRLEVLAAGNPITGVGTQGHIAELRSSASPPRSALPASRRRSVTSSLAAMRACREQRSTDTGAALVDTVVSGGGGEAWGVGFLSESSTAPQATPALPAAPTLAPAPGLPTSGPPQPSPATDAGEGPASPAEPGSGDDSPGAVPTPQRAATNGAADGTDYAPPPPPFPGVERAATAPDARARGDGQPLPRTSTRPARGGHGATSPVRRAMASAAALCKEGRYGEAVTRLRAAAGRHQATSPRASPLWTAYRALEAYELLRVRARFAVEGCRKGPAPPRSSPLTQCRVEARGQASTEPRGGTVHPRAQARVASGRGRRHSGPGALPAGGTRSVHVAHPATACFCPPQATAAESFATYGPARGRAASVARAALQLHAERPAGGDVDALPPARRAALSALARGADGQDPGESGPRGSPPSRAGSDRGQRAAASIKAWPSSLRNARPPQRTGVPPRAAGRG